MTIMNNYVSRNRRLQTPIMDRWMDAVLRLLLQQMEPKEVSTSLYRRK